MKYIKALFVVLLIFFAYCTFLWYNPKAAEGLDYIFSSEIHTKLHEKIMIYDKNVRDFGSYIRSKIENPAPNTMQDLEERQEINSNAN